MATVFAPDLRHIGNETGFTIIDLLVGLAIMGVLAALAIPVSTQYIINAKADSSLEATSRAFTNARDRAVAERRNVLISFTSDNVQFDRQEINGTGDVIGTTPIAEVTLENGQQFMQFSGVPDTPDSFGATSATAFNGTPPFMFASDGTLVDADGDVANASIFTGVPDEPLTARAVTIFGATGLVRGWKWRGNRWFK